MREECYTDVEIINRSFFFKKYTDFISIDKKREIE